VVQNASAGCAFSFREDTGFRFLQSPDRFRSCPYLGKLQRRFNDSLVIITLNDLGDHEALKESVGHSAVFQNIRRISSTNTEHLRKALSASYKQVKKRSIFYAL